MPKIISPCINVCDIDGATGWCSGCGRSLDEIANWVAGSPAWRDGVMQALAARKAQLVGVTPPLPGSGR